MPNGAPCLCLMPCHDYVYDLVIREGGLRQVICIVRKRLVRLCGHVVRLLPDRPLIGSCLVGIGVWTMLVAAGVHRGCAR